MEEGHVHAGVVHLAIRPRASAHVVEVGRVELLRVVLAVDGPGHAALLPVDTKAHVRQLGLHVASARTENPRVGGRTVADLPRGLMVTGVGGLHPS